MAVKLDTEITPELKREGLKRELIRFINLMRKEANLSLSDKTNVYIVGANNELAEVVNNMKAEILRETLSADLILAVENKAPNQKEVKIGEEKIILGLEKI